MRKLILGLAIAALASAQPTAIRDDQALFNNGWNYSYAVDSVNGSDSNDGLSRWRPFQTLTKLLTKSIGNYNSIGLARGSYWRGTVNISADYIGGYAYGSGARPIIDGAELCTSWTKTGGLTNTYQCAITFETGGATEALNAFENGAFLTYKTSTATVDSTAASYTVSSMTVSPAILYVHATGNGNPASNGKTYEYTAHYHGWGSPAIHGTNMAQGWYVHSLHTTRNLDNNGSITVGRLARMYDIVADYGGKHNVYCSDGCYIQDSTIADLQDNSGGSLMALNEDSPIGLGSTLRRVTFNYSNSASVAGFSGDGPIIAHANTGGTFGPIVFDTLTVTSPYIIGMSNVGSLTVTGGTYTSSPGAALGPVFNVGAPSTYSNMTWNGAGGSNGVFNLSTGTQATVTNSTITASGFLATMNASTGASLNMQNVTFTLSGTQGAYFWDNGATGATVTRQQSTFNSTATPDHLLAGTTMVSDYNTWSGLSAAAQTAYLAYEYTSGNDLHSTPNLTAVVAARWDLASAYVSGSNIPDLDGKGLNLTLPGSGHNPTSQSGYFAFSGSSQYLSGPNLSTTLAAYTPAATITAVFQYTGTPGSLSTAEILTGQAGAGTIKGGATASKAVGLMCQFNEATPTSTISVDDGSWHAVTIISDGSKHGHIWVDGVSQGSQTSLNDNVVTVGSAVSVGASTSGTQAFQGNIAYVEYDQGQIPSTQMAAYYAGLKSSLAAQGVTLP